MKINQAEIERLKKEIKVYEEKISFARSKIQSLEGEAIATLTLGDKIKVKRQDERGENIIRKGVFLKKIWNSKNYFAWVDVEIEAFNNKARFESDARDLVQIGWEDTEEIPEVEEDDRPRMARLLEVKDVCCYCKNFEEIERSSLMGVHVTRTNYCRKHDAVVGALDKCDDFEPREEEEVKAE